MRRRVILSSLLAVGAFTIAGCASSGGSTADSSSAPAGATTGAAAPASTAAAAACSPATMKTHTANAITIATDSPAYEPWFSGNDPTNGKGFESAVAYAVAKQLGYSTNQVHWVKATFDSVIAPTPKSYDFDINEVSITAKRAQVVDFSSGYYDVAQAVVVLKGSKYAAATSIADLHGAKLGAQQGTTSLDAINDEIKPGTTPAEYPTNNLAVQALKNGQIDGLVVDLPTAFYVTSAQVQNATIAGQLEPTGSPEQFGLVLSHGSSLTSCVSKAVDALRANGTLAKLQQKWLAQAGNAPVLK